LHGFNQMSLVLTGTTTLQADGSFIFPNIQISDELFFLASLDFQGLTYGSEVGGFSQGATSLYLPIEVYETTTDTSGLSVDRLHFFFDFVDDKTVRVVELYVISNPSDKTIVSPGEGQPVLSFTLPTQATGLEFQEGSIGDRYVLTADGFGDLSPVRPGMGSYQVLFSYLLPYNRRLELARPLKMDVDAVVVLIPENGLKAKGDTLQDGGTRTVQDAVYHMYNGSAMTAGQELRFVISGNPTQGSGLASSSTTSTIIGLGALGAVLMITGIWFYRRNLPLRPAAEVEEVKESPLSSPSGRQTAESIMDAILALDDQYQEGQLPEGAYQERRVELKAQLREKMGK